MRAVYASSCACRCRRARARKKAVWKICRYACPGDRVPHALLQGKYTSLVDRGHKVLKASAVHH